MVPVAIVVAFLVPAMQAPEARQSERAFRLESHAHSVTLRVRTGAFDRSAHTFEKVQKKWTVIDGRRALGVDERLPEREIAFIGLTVDGKEVEVPRRFYSFCYEPRFDTDSFACKLDESGENVLAFMQGGDAAGSYSVVWVLRKDGRHAVFTSTCSDCPYKDILNFFQDIRD